MSANASIALESGFRPHCVHRREALNHSIRTSAIALGYRADQSRYSGNFDRGSTRVTTIVVVTVVTVVVVVGMTFAVAAIA
jgi:hypothetical protein